jgi:hypothetical protein
MKLKGFKQFIAEKQTDPDLVDKMKNIQKVLNQKLNLSATY